VNRLWQILLLISFFCLLLAHGPAHAQTTTRLVLKDGSYQLASKWEVNGDRVRYFSTERHEWEELPFSMVDWPATNSFEQQRESQRNLELKQPEDEADSESQPDRFSIAPGLHLPSSGGVYLLDSYKEEPQLAELGQTNGEISRQTGHSILRGAFSPLSSSKTIELKGEHAAVQSHILQPMIFLDLGGDPEAPPLPLAERFRIARLEPKKDVRILGSVKVAITGRVSQQEIYLPATVEQVAGGWIRLRPSQPLSPGEYAVVEMLDAKTMNLYVWDFGVNPSSPENSKVSKAVAHPSSPAGGAAPPDLQGRPR